VLGAKILVVEVFFITCCFTPMLSVCNM
jgi:hypothetical protein